MPPALGALGSAQAVQGLGCREVGLEGAARASLQGGRALLPGPCQAGQPQALWPSALGTAVPSSPLPAQPLPRVPQRMPLFRCGPPSPSPSGRLAKALPWWTLPWSRTLPVVAAFLAVPSPSCPRAVASLLPHPQRSQPVLTMPSSREPHQPTPREVTSPPFHAREFLLRCHHVSSCCHPSPLWLWVAGSLEVRLLLTHL